MISSINESQFIVKNLREYLELIGMSQEFTYIATPEENALVKAPRNFKERSS